MPEIKIVENPSELGAGTRGSSLGIGALQVVARQRKDDFFGQFERFLVDHQNDMLDFPTIYNYAKRIDGLAEVYQNTVDILNHIYAGKDFPVVLSGDHSCAAGTVAGIKRAFPTKRLGVIWIDAHADLHTPYTTPSGNIHGMPLSVILGFDNKENAINVPNPNVVTMWAELLELGAPSPKIKSEDLVYIAVRDTEPLEEDYMAKHSIRNFTVQELRQKGWEKITEEVKTKLSACDIVYVSFDVDSMDPEEVSNGTGTPSPDGLTIFEATSLMTNFAAWEKTCCVEFVEINPCLDNKINKMAEVAFDILKVTTHQIENRI
ncbi:MAG: arginase [Crocinitomix sp.]|nr:arginase [Crocinitomix sp.]